MTVGEIRALRAICTVCLIKRDQLNEISWPACICYASCARISWSSRKTWQTL